MGGEVPMRKPVYQLGWMIDIRPREPSRAEAEKRASLKRQIQRLHYYQNGESYLTESDRREHREIVLRRRSIHW